MTKLLTIAALALSLTGGVAFAQDSGDTDPGSNSSNSGEFSGTEAEGAAGTTNAPNAPFLGNRDIMANFFTDDTMTTIRTDDEFRAAYEALTDEQRAGIMQECQSPAGFERFCDTFLSTGSTTAQ